VGVFIFSALTRVATAYYYLIYHPQEEAASVAKKQPKYRLQQPPADIGHHQVAYI
jgi:predicted metal-dependent hydrolase